MEGDAARETWSPPLKSECPRLSPAHPNVSLHPKGHPGLDPPAPAALPVLQEGTGLSALTG